MVMMFGLASSALSRQLTITAGTGDSIVKGSNGRNAHIP
jgi:hypothetical protein